MAPTSPLRTVRLLWLQLKCPCAIKSGGHAAAHSPRLPVRVLGDNCCSAAITCLLLSSRGPIAIAQAVQTSMSGARALGFQTKLSNDLRRTLRCSATAADSSANPIRHCPESICKMKTRANDPGLCRDRPCCAKQDVEADAARKRGRCLLVESSQFCGGRPLVVGSALLHGSLTQRRVYAEWLHRGSCLYLVFHAAGCSIQQSTAMPLAHQ